MIVDLTLSGDQRLIEQGVCEFLRDRLPVERLRDAAGACGGTERALWAELADLGLFGLGIAEAMGGLGLGLAEEVLIARALGRHLVSPAVLAQMAAPHLALDAPIRAGLIDGSIRAAFANRIDRTFAHLIDGEGAGQVIVLDAEGASLLDRDSLGPADAVAGMDETVALARIALPAAAAARTAASDRASLLIAAYLTGIAQGATDMAVAYAKIREQFGQPIGAFQAIKHQCADMATRAAAAEAQTFHAAVTYGFDRDDAAEVTAARMLSADAALANGKANIQIHGGMGFTAECDAHLYLKRAHLLATLGSNRSADRRRLLG